MVLVLSAVCVSCAMHRVRICVTFASGGTMEHGIALTLATLTRFTCTRPQFSFFPVGVAASLPLPASRPPAIAVSVAHAAQESNTAHAAQESSVVVAPGQDTPPNSSAPVRRSAGA